MWYDLLWLCFSVASEVVGLLGEYLHGDLGQDLDGLKRGGSSLQHLQRTLNTVCQGLSRYELGAPSLPHRQSCMGNVMKI